MAGPMPAVPNVMKVQMQGTIPGEIWENVLHFGYLGPPPSVSSTATFAATIGSQWAQHVTALQATTSILQQVTVTDLSGVSAAQATAQILTAGTRTGAEVFANSAVLISYPSPMRYRGGKPRTYLLAGVSSDMASPMSWTPAFQSLVSTAWQAFLNTTIGIAVAGTQITNFCLVRQHGKFLPNAGPPNFVLTTPIVLNLSVPDLAVHTQVASQKGRIGRRSK